MSDMSEGSIEWEDAAEELGLDLADLQALEVLEDEDGDYTPPSDDEMDEMDDDDDPDYHYPGQYIEFLDVEDDDVEDDEVDMDDIRIDGRDAEEDEEDDEDEDEDNTYGAALGVNAPSQTALLQLAALMEAAGGGSRAGISILERLLGPSRAGMTTRQRTAGERAADRLRERWWQPQVEPHPAGLALLQSGEFGPVGPWSPTAPTAAQKGRRRPSEVYAARQRYSHGAGRRYMSSRYPVAAHVHDPPIPNTPGTVVASYPNVPYVGQFCGPNDSIFYSATRGFMLYLYDMMGTRSSRPGSGNHGAIYADPAIDTEYANDVDSDSDDGHILFGGWNPRRTGRQQRMDETSLRRIKAEQGEVGQWTVTDAHADREGKRMIYSSITPYVYMMNTTDDGAPHVELDFTHNDRYEGFGIWSIRFSADGKEVVAGGSTGRIMVYDIAAERRSLKVKGHLDDVNAVCFADESSTNILVSGSDDGYVKIWDRRSLASSTPAGVLPGATEGITYTAPKGDGRYIVVNSKDQAARLYDLRKMRSWSEFEGEQDAAQRWGFPRFDYRNMRYPPPKRLAHPRDCSVMTYRGHCVLRTLIRCHFSPLESTGQSYIYSGSADGLIHIWSLDGRVVQVLNRADSRALRPGGAAAAAGYTDPSGEERSRARRLGASIHEQGTNYTVRDVAWHSQTPTLMSTCWELEGRYRDGTGSIAMHEWKGLGKGGLRSLEDWVEKAAQESAERPRS